MAFWSNSSTEPKREFRWLLLADNLPKWIIKSVTRPVLTTTDTAHKFHGYTFYYPGTSTWNTIDITLVDPVAPDSNNIIAAMLYRAGYNVPFTDNAITTMAKKSASEALGGIAIQTVDAEGKTLEKWILNNPFVTTADFGGTMSYDSDNLMNLKLTLRYDWATLDSMGRLSGTSPNPASLNGRKTGTKYWSKS